VQVLFQPTLVGTGALNGAFFADPNCTQQLPIVTQNGQTYWSAGINPMDPNYTARTQNIYYAGQLSGFMQASAAATGYATAFLAFALNPGPPSVLSAQGFGTVAPGECDPGTMITVRVKDIYGNYSSFNDAAHEVGLTLPVAGIAFSDSSCADVMNNPQLTIPQYSNSAAFFFKSIHSGSFPITASSGALSPTTFTEKVVATTPNRIQITDLNGNAFGAGSIDTCYNLKATVLDVYNNPISFSSPINMNLYASGSNQYLYPTTGCPGPNASGTILTLPANSPSANFSFFDPYNQYTWTVVSFKWGGSTIAGADEITISKPCDLTAVTGWGSPSLSWPTNYWTYATWLTNNNQATWGWFYNPYIGQWVWGSPIYSGCDALGNDYGFWGDERRNGCFSGRTLITLAGGLRKRADEVRAGDELWNPIRQQPIRVKRVLSGPEKLPLVEIGYGMESIQVTTLHPMVTPNGLKQAKAVVVGDWLLGSDRRFHPVSWRRDVAYSQRQVVYNFDIDTQSQLPEDHLLVSDGMITGDWNLQNLLEKGYVPKQ
jgi:hypothetical protein